MKALLSSCGTVLGVAFGVLLYQLAKHFWGWPGAVALGAVIVAIYFAADAAIERSKRR